MDKPKFKPLRDWILLPDPRKTQTESGIILSEQAADKMTTNILEVLDVGPECKSVKQGDTVMIDPAVAGKIIVVEETSYVLVSEFHVLGVL
jgi:co-chaperonin GroES (HSP10)|tara:strand:+ start:1052 stop:1324 length:273 start_codon:yes stop_codon:yes gene_type:complete